MNNEYEQYCTGCGLCCSVNNIHFTKDEKGFLFHNLTENDMDFCSRVCPVSGTIPYEYRGNI